jgi:hypothetical protein
MVLVAGVVMGAKAKKAILSRGREQRSARTSRAKK